MFAKVMVLFENDVKNWAAATCSRENMKYTSNTYNLDGGGFSGKNIYRCKVVSYLEALKVSGFHVVNAKLRVSAFDSF